MKSITKMCNICNREIPVTEDNVYYVLKIDCNFYCHTCQQTRTITSANNADIEKVLKEIENSEDNEDYDFYY